MRWDEKRWALLKTIWTVTNDLCRYLPSTVSCGRWIHRTATKTSPSSAVYSRSTRVRRRIKPGISTRQRLVLGGHWVIRPSTRRRCVRLKDVSTGLEKVLCVEHNTQFNTSTVGLRQLCCLKSRTKYIARIRNFVGCTICPKLTQNIAEVRSEWCCWFRTPVSACGFRALVLLVYRMFYLFFQADNMINW